MEDVIFGTLMLTCDDFSYNWFHSYNMLKNELWVQILEYFTSRIKPFSCKMLSQNLKVHGILKW